MFFFSQQPALQTFLIPQESYQYDVANNKDFGWGFQGSVVVLLFSPHWLQQITMSLEENSAFTYFNSFNCLLHTASGKTDSSCLTESMTLWHHMKNKSIFSVVRKCLAYIYHYTFNQQQQWTKQYLPLAPSLFSFGEIWWQFDLQRPNWKTR